MVLRQGSPRNRFYPKLRNLDTFSGFIVSLKSWKLHFFVKVQHSMEKLDFHENRGFPENVGNSRKSRDFPDSAPPKSSKYDKVQHSFPRLGSEVPPFSLKSTYFHQNPPFSPKITRNATFPRKPDFSRLGAFWVHPPPTIGKPQETHTFSDHESPRGPSGPQNIHFCEIHTF